MTLTLPDLQDKLQEWDGCALKKQANVVLGEGNFEADIIFIGEAPGKKEDELGRPFVGASGKFLDDLIESIGWCRSQVYISNVVKYRPPENRDPTTEEKNQCLPWLMMEIGIIKPKVIVPLGRHALGNFCKDASISDVHGVPQKYSNNITIFPLYHPAAALHNGGLRQTLKDDFQKLHSFLEENNISPPS